MFVLVKAIVVLVVLVLLLVTEDDAFYTTKYPGYLHENYFFGEVLLIFIPRCNQ
jgi:hypothetical protein